ncbi:MAG: hypothetical protein LAP61_21985 [Acidobacteriia bacterium]|nr:hypothetical protein [Terriglobia bacterium]
MSPLTAGRLRRKARRFRFERLAATFASVPTFGAFALGFVAGTIFGDIALCRIGCAIIAASLAYTTYRLLRSDWSLDRASDCITHYRAHLVRRRDFLRRFPYWGGLPAASGVVLATLGWLLAEPDRWFDAASAGILGVGLQIALWASNNRTAAQLQKEIDLLEAA